MTSNKKWVKDPSANLYYIFDFAQNTNKNGYDGDYLQTGEELSSATILTDDGISASDVSIIKANTQVQFYLTGGTAGSEYNVTCRITTTNNNIDEYTKTIKILNT